MKQDYLTDLFVASFTQKATIDVSLEQQLEAMAIRQGRTTEEAKLDVRRVMNLHKAVTLLIEKSTKQCA